MKKNSILKIYKEKVDLYQKYNEFYYDKNEPLVYVCKNYICNLPTSDIDKISELLNNNN